MTSTEHTKLPKLTRESNWDVWSAQFEEYVRMRGLSNWLANAPDSSKADEVSGDANCKGHMLLATNVVALVRLVKNAANAKSAFEALKEDFLGRERVRRHEIYRESKEFRQKKGESFLSYCDRGADHYAKVLAVGGSDQQFADDFIVGLSEPFRSSNSARLTNIADKDGFEALLGDVRQSSRLFMQQDGTAFAASAGRKFTGNCFYCGKRGHKASDCRKKKRDEREGKLDGAGGSKPQVPNRPAAAFVCEGVAAAVQRYAASDDPILFDTCCTDHVVIDRKFLTNFSSDSAVKFMRMGGDERHRVLGEGTAVLHGGPAGTVELRNVLFVPTMIHNIVSSGKVSSRGGRVIIDDGGVSIQRHADNVTILTGTLRNGMYHLHARLHDVMPDSADDMLSTVGSTDDEHDGCALAASAAITLQVAHERLGHLNATQVKKLVSSNAVTGLQVSDPHSELPSCTTCHQAKQTRGSFPASHSRARKPLEIVHMDTIGPVQQQGYDGSRYAVPVHDDYSSFCDVISVVGKDQISDAVIELLAYWERQTGYPLLCIRSDNGTEFQGDLASWCKHHGVKREYSAVYTPEQNGRAERMNRTLIEGTRALLLQRDCPTRFWPLAMHAVSYIHNRVPAARSSAAPIALFLCKIPDLSSLRVFGCSASLSLPKKKRDGKFGAVSVNGVFVGYSEGTKGWRIAVGNCIHESPSVVFREHLQGDHSPDPVSDTGGNESDSDCEVASGVIPMHVPPPPALPPPAAPAPTPAPTPAVTPVATPVATPAATPVAPPAASAGSTAADTATENNDDAGHVGRPQRERKAPDFFVPGNASVARGEAAEALLDNVLDPNCVFGTACAVAGQTVPKNYADIANWGDMQQLWYASYEKEMQSIRDMGVIEEIAECDVPQGARVLTSKLDFRNKYGPSGDITERKTRLCVHGFKQVQGIDYTETTAPTAAANTTRLFFAEAAYRGFHVHQMDVKTAFLHAPLQEELYMRPPKGIPQLQGKLWRLHKAIYGLKQAANVWHATLSEELGRFGFVPCLTDPCLFVKTEGERRTHLLVYVDDMLIGGEYSDVVKAKQHVQKCFKTKDMGVAYHFLGFLIHRDVHGIRLTQEQYTKTILERFGYEHAHPKRTPFNEGTAKESAVRCQCGNAERKKQHLRDSTCDCTCVPYTSEIDFAAFVGAVMFLATRSRPDIAYSLGVLSRYVCAPKAFHEPLVKHLLRYLKGTIDWGLWYPSRQYLQECSEKIPDHMHLYTDSDHSGEEKKRSTSGWVVVLHGCVVAWGSKLQPTAVESTCAAEFVAACMGENSALCLKDLLFEMTGEQVSAELLVDNQSAVSKLNRPAGGNMWLDLKWRVVHQRHVSKLVSINYISTTEQRADIFTKNLTPSKHEDAVQLLNMYCQKMKNIEYDTEEERQHLLSTGVTVPLKKHACVYKGIKNCIVCEEFFKSMK